MKVSLRKATAIQNLINETIKGITLTVEVRISEFVEPAPTILKANTTLLENVVRKVDLLKALCAIRTNVGIANASNEVSNKLTQVANLEKLIQLINTISIATVQEDSAIIAGKLDKIRNGKSERSYYSADEVVTSCLSQEDVDSHRVELAGLKKQKQQLQDEILELNIRTEIKLDDNTVSVLTKEGIL